MRKALTLAVLLIITLPLGAESVFQAFTPHYPRNLSMGGASVASSRYEEVIFSNPALVGSDNSYLSLPSFSFTLYNFNQLVQPGGVLDIFLTQGGDEAVNRALNQLINSIGAGESDVVSAQLSLGFISGFTGLSVDSGLRVHSTGTGGESSTLILDADFAISLAFALPIEINEHHRLSFGISAHLIFRGLTLADMYSSAPGGFTAGSIYDFYKQDDTLAGVLNQVPVAFGFAIPLNLGFTYDWRDIITAGLVVRNLNGRYHMQSYSGVNQLYYMLTGGYLGSVPPGNPETGISFEADTDVTLDLGFAVSTPQGGVWDWIDMTFAFDLVDVWNLFARDLSTEGLISRIRTGVEISFMKTFDFRFGINSGYMSFGFTFDFQVFTIDFLYATLEYGETTGSRPLDLFTIAFSLGFEK